VFAGVKPGTVLDGGDDLRGKRQAVFLFYPVRSEDEEKAEKTPTMGFVLLFPKNSIRQQIRYTVADPTRGDAVVVPADAGKQQALKNRL
jgi:hypothetical protein